MDSKKDIYRELKNNPSFAEYAPDYLGNYYGKKKVNNIDLITQEIIAIANKYPEYDAVNKWAQALIRLRNNYETELILCDNYIIKRYLNLGKNKETIMSSQSIYKVHHYLTLTDLRPKVYNKYITSLNGLNTAQLLGELFLKLWNSKFYSYSYNGFSYHIKNIDIWENPQFKDLRLRIISAGMADTLLEKLMEDLPNIDSKLLFYYGLDNDNQLGIVL